MQTEYMKMIQNSGEITDRGSAILRPQKPTNTMNTRKEIFYGIQSRNQFTKQL